MPEALIVSAVRTPAGRAYNSLLFIDSRDRVSIAVNQGDYSKKFNVILPATIFIPRKGAPIKGK